jgi:hypothetical protein
MPSLGQEIPGASKKEKNKPGQVKTDSHERQTVISTLASGVDDRRGSLGTRSSKYGGLGSSAQIDVTIYGGRVKVAMRFIYMIWSNV